MKEKITKNHIPSVEKAQPSVKFLPNHWLIWLFYYTICGYSRGKKNKCLFSFAKITTELCISSIFKKLYIIKARLLNLMMPCFTRRSAAKNSSPDCFLNALVQVRLLSLLQKEKNRQRCRFSGKDEPF